MLQIVQHNVYSVQLKDNCISLISYANVEFVYIQEFSPKGAMRLISSVPRIKGNQVVFSFWPMMEITVNNCPHVMTESISLYRELSLSTETMAIAPVTVLIETQNPGF